MDIRNRHFDAMTSEEWIRTITNEAFTKEELGWLYCWGLLWRGWLTDRENLPAVTKAMLDRGMDPNQLVTEESPLDDREVKSFGIPMVAVVVGGLDDLPEPEAESLKLLLEHGGDPNTVYCFGITENVFEFYVEDEFVHGPDLPGGRFYGLILCAAYGGKNCNGYQPFTMLIDVPISIFKDYKRYWYEYEEHPGTYGSTMYIIEKDTGKRVARYF